MNIPAVLPTITVTFPAVLRDRVGNRKSTLVTGLTIREIIAALDDEFPGVRFNLCYETGELRPYVNLFLDKINIRYLQGVDTQVANGATLLILQSVAGG